MLMDSTIEEILKFYFDANFRMGYNLIHEDFTVFNTGATKVVGAGLDSPLNFGLS